MIASKEQQYSVYVDGKYVCDVWAVSQLMATIMARYEEPYQEAVKGMRNRSYMVTAVRVGELGELN